MTLQRVLPGDLHVADGHLHSLYGGLCRVWVRCWAQDVHQEQLGRPGTHTYVNDSYTTSSATLAAMDYLQTQACTWPVPDQSASALLC